MQSSSYVVVIVVPWRPLVADIEHVVLYAVTERINVTILSVASFYNSD